jgi:RNA polymerase sigma-70 factor (ECF subfamily)
MHETDEVIAERVKNGDKESFGILIERYEEKLTRYARKFLFFREDGSDLVQDVFIKAYVNINSFDTGQKFSPWVYRIAHNEFINELKRKQNAPVPFFDPDTIFPHPIARETTDQHAQDEEMKRLLDSALVKLEVKYRESLVLYFYEGMSYQDIADVLQVPTSTVGVRISRGKERLRNLYGHPTSV